MTKNDLFVIHEFGEKLSIWDLNLSCDKVIPRVRSNKTVTKRYNSSDSSDTSDDNRCQPEPRGTWSQWQTVWHTDRPIHTCVQVCDGMGNWISRIFSTLENMGYWNVSGWGCGCIVCVTSSSKSRVNGQMGWVEKFTIQTIKGHPKKVKSISTCFLPRTSLDVI